MESKLELVPPISSWQSWPRGYEPSNAELESMSEAEYDAWARYEFGLPKIEWHPTIK